VQAAVVHLRARLKFVWGQTIDLDLTGRGTGSGGLRNQGAEALAEGWSLLHVTPCAQARASTRVAWNRSACDQRAVAGKEFAREGDVGSGAPRLAVVEDGRHPM